MQIACCQFDVAWEDKPANYRKVRAMVASARLDAGAMLLLPEMFATGFSMNTGAKREECGQEQCGEYRRVNHEQVVEVARCVRED